MEIRKATIDDIGIIVKYNYNLANETESKSLDLDILTKGVKAIIEDERKGVYHVCVIDNQVVGQIMYTYEWSDWRNGTIIWIQSVYVNKEYRKRGVFKALYNYIKNICYNDSNIVGIRLYVEKENFVAQKTYEDLGMEQCGYYMYEYMKNSIL